MWMEEQNQDRVNVKRTLQLVDALGLESNGGAQPSTIASACPFCMTMLTDGVKSKNLEDKVRQLDVVELLERACALAEVPADGVPMAVPDAGGPLANDYPSGTTAE